MGKINDPNHFTLDARNYNELLIPVVNPCIRLFLASPMTNLTSRQRRVTRRYRDNIYDYFASTRRAIFEIYDPSKVTFLGSDHSDTDVYITNRLQIVSSDMMIICRTYASDGVGAEKVIAENSKIPILTIHPKDAHISRMTAASPSIHLDPIAIDRVDDIKFLLEERITDICRKAISFQQLRRQRFSSGWARNLRKIVVIERFRRHWSRSNLAQKAGISCGTITLIEQNDDFVGNLSQMDVMSLERSFDLKQGTLSGPGALHKIEPPLKVHKSHAESWVKSLDSIADYVLHYDPHDDDLAVGMWKYYDEMMSEVVAGRTDLSEPITIERWRARYNSLRNYS